ncbi:MAG: hypothetical protein WBK28_03385 [Minisyncoccia bacterium]
MNLSEVMRAYTFRHVKAHRTTRRGNSQILSVKFSIETGEYQFVADAHARLPFFVTNERIGMTLLMSGDGTPFLRETDLVVSTLLKGAGCRHFVYHAAARAA